MNTNDETREKVSKKIDIAMENAIGIYDGQLHTPWQEVLGQTTEDIIALVAAAQDAGPDAERVEAAAKAIHAINVEDFPEMYGTWEEEVAREETSDTFTYVSFHRRLARAALAAAGDDLDAMLNRVSDDATVEIFNDGDGFHVDLYYGDMVAMCTGATRRDAVLGAVEKARKEQSNEDSR